MNKKKILFISQYFYPENFKGNDMVFELSKRDFQVVVVTGKPNYPKGKFYKGYSFFNRISEEINGVTVYRLPLIPRGSGSGLRLVLNYISFYLSSLIYFKIYPISFEYDIVITQQLSPMTSSLPAIWYKNKRNTPLITWVLDLWPESVISTTSFKGGFVIQKLESLAKKLYKESTLILVSSRSFIKPISNRKIDKDKIVHFPNWADEIFELNNYELDFPKLPYGFNVVFAGNFGEAQDFKNIIQAVKLIGHNKGINFVFVGSGRYEHELKRYISDYQLENVFVYPQFSIEYMPSLYMQASVMLLTLKGGDEISNTVPAKLQTYMSSSKAVIGMIDGEASHIIREAGCGFVASAGDFKALADYIIKMKNLSKSELKLMEDRAYSYYHSHFSRTKAINQISRIVNEFT